MCVCARVITAQCPAEHSCLYKYMAEELNNGTLPCIGSWIQFAPPSHTQLRSHVCGPPHQPHAAETKCEHGGGSDLYTDDPCQCRDTTATCIPSKHRPAFGLLKLWDTSAMTQGRVCPSTLCPSHTHTRMYTQSNKGTYSHGTVTNTRTPSAPSRRNIYK